MVEPKIFGIGLCKTGTQSLTRALEILGIPTIHYPHDDTTYDELKRGLGPLSIMKRYQAGTDLPIAHSYSQLDAGFPGSKFILTVRSPDAWLSSARRHWRANRRFFNNDRPQPEQAMHRFALFMSACVFGCYEFQEERFRFVYAKHREHVLSYFADRSHDLLVLDICGGDGWYQLCSFLSRPIPHLPFPFLGRRLERSVSEANRD